LSGERSEVVMFCPQFRPIVGGAERQVEKLSVALAARGAVVTILTPHLHPEQPAREELNGIRVIRFPFRDLSRRYPIAGIALINIPWVLWQVARQVRPYLKKARVLHCHIAALQTAGAALAGRLAGVPVICKSASASELSDQSRGPSGRVVAWLLRRYVGEWIATTAAVQEGLEQAGVERRRIVRIPNGVEMTEPRSPRRLEKGARRFLYLGRLSDNARRDVPTLISAFGKVAAVHGDVELALVGGGDRLEETRELAGRSTARERISLPGFDDPEKWFAWADCFVLPSTREGLSNALLEAMAEGLPCIANDIPPNREVLRDGEAGVLVPVGDPSALEAAMERMITDGDFAAEFAEKAIRRVEETYSIKAVADRYALLYQREEAR
jgi:glycosyltransferase involved in cell wall biosynthesis